MEGKKRVGWTAYLQDISNFDQTNVQSVDPQSKIISTTGVEEESEAWTVLIVYQRKFSLGEEESEGKVLLFYDQLNSGNSFVFPSSQLNLSLGLERKIHGYADGLSEKV